MAGRPAPEQPTPFPWRSDMLAGKKAIVTGGSAGIGAAITEALVSVAAAVPCYDSFGRCCLLRAPDFVMSSLALPAALPFYGLGFRGLVSKISNFPIAAASSLKMVVFWSSWLPCGFFATLFLAAIASLKIKIHVVSQPSPSPSSALHLTVYLCTMSQLQAGCAVVVLARSRAKFDVLVPILQQKGLSTKDLDFISIDLSSTDDIRRAAADANEWAGGCADILVNNGENMRQQQQQQQPEWDCCICMGSLHVSFTYALLPWSVPTLAYTTLVWRHLIFW